MPLKNRKKGSKENPVSNPEKKIMSVNNPTIKDVAALAGVSAATVGRVIGNYGYVGAESRDKVLKAIKQLGFKPNAVARSLKSKRTKTWGYLLPTITNLFYAQIAKGLQDVANSHGYNVIICNTDINQRRTTEYGLMLLENRVDGIIISLPADESVYKLVESCRLSGIPVVVCHGARSIPDVDRVMCDDFKGGYLAAKHLIDMGHRRIGMISVKGSTTSKLRLDGFRQAFQEAGVELIPDLIIETADFSENAGYTGTKLLLMREQLPTAIIAANDIMAMGVVDAIDEANLLVPKDISVVGFDNTFAAFMRPRLTTVSLPMYQVGQIGAQLLLERVEKRYHGEQRVITLPEELVVRGSTTVVKDIRQQATGNSVESCP